MKIIKKEYKVYTIDELSSEAQERALEDWQQGDVAYSPFLTDDLREYIHEILQEEGLKELSTITPYYSLANRQGDGLMFEAVIQDKEGNLYTIRQAGQYYHERSTDIEGRNAEGDWIEAKDFEEKIYIPICEAVRDRGYKEIEYRESEEAFHEYCEANDEWFLADGKVYV